MSLNTGLVDLTAIVGMLASWGIVPNALQFLRDMFLDALLARASEKQRNAILRLLLFLLSLAGILLLAWVLGQPFSLNLAVSAVLAASGGAVGAHVTYQNLQKPATNVVFQTATLAPAADPFAPLSFDAPTPTPSTDAADETSAQPPEPPEPPASEPPPAATPPALPDARC